LYRVTAAFPSEEKFGIVAQIRRAALSVTSNIAEGHGRSSNQDFARFLFMSLGSIREFESLIEISHELGFIVDENGLTANIQEVARMTTAFITHPKTED
jgi:four helix bundle protein